MKTPSCVIRFAENIALRSSSRFRVSAVIHDKRRILAWGYNSMEQTHPKAPTLESKRHAEFVAILDYYRTFQKQPWGLSLYVHRLRRDGTKGLAAPCVHCQKSIYASGIAEVKYSED